MDESLDYREPRSGSSDTHEYWARKDSPDLHEHLIRRTERHYRTLEASPTLGLIATNWAYYHGQWTGQEGFLGGGIQRQGSQGEFAFMGSNTFRNLLHHLYILTVRDRPAPQAKATNNDSESLRSCTIAENLVEQYLRKDRVEKRLNLAAEESIVLTEGYVALDWDGMKGDILGSAKVEEGMPPRFDYSGDLGIWNASFLDVVKDNRRYPWQEHDWVCVRRPRNKWDLAALYPEKADDIIQTKEELDSRFDIFSSRETDSDRDDDVISEWTFYHRPTPAMPLGRKFCFVKGAWLTSDVLPDYLKGIIPVFRCSPGEILLTSLGYSPGFDLQGPQEAANMILSSLVTNFDSQAIQNLWSPPGNNLSAAQVAGGLRIIQSSEKPEPLQLLQNPSDAYKFFETVIQQMELTSGVNSVLRGQPEASLKSGKALSLIETKAVQYASGLIQSYYHLFEDVATCMIRILSAKLSEGHPKVVEIAGKRDSMNFEVITREDLSRVDRIVIESSNPLSKTLAGRMEWAEKFLVNGMIKSPEQLMQVFTTGRLEPIYEAERATLGLIASENEALMRGEVAPVLKTDNQSLHLREQVALLSTPAVRQNEEVAANVLGHCLVHVAMLYLPDVIDLQITQGFQVPQLTETIPPGILTGINPEYQGSFSEQDLQILTMPPNPMGQGQTQPSENEPNEAQVQAQSPAA